MLKLESLATHFRFFPCVRSGLETSNYLTPHSLLVIPYLDLLLQILQTASHITTIFKTEFDFSHRAIRNARQKSSTRSSRNICVIISIGKRLPLVFLCCYL
jgi:hypothetical protein